MAVKHCRICGGDIHIEKREHYGVFYYVVCNDCEYKSDGYSKRSELITEYNRNRKGAKHGS